eukprot:jgi/Hompol1/5772/HPOL_002055-RA
MFEGSQRPALRLAMMFFVWHEIVFFGRYIPYMIADMIPYFRQYKIQPDKEIPSSQRWYCALHVIFWQLAMQLPMMLAFHPVAMAMGMKFLQIPFPSYANMAATTLFFMFCEDMYQYFVHRLLHWGSLYKNIHKQHHTYSAPFGLAAEYAHPIETLVLGIGFFVGPLLWVAVLRDLHVINIFVWVLARLIQVVDSHSGYDFPWALRHLLPFWAGADFHDYHHMAFVGNYSSFFRWWDWIMGTDRAFQAWKDKTAQQSKSASPALQVDAEISAVKPAAVAKPVAAKAAAAATKTSTAKARNGASAKNRKRR